jgi:hypothetical protein
MPPTLQQVLELAQRLGVLHTVQLAASQLRSVQNPPGPSPPFVAQHVAPPAHVLPGVHVTSPGSAQCPLVQNTPAAFPAHCSFEEQVCAHTLVPLRVTNV